MRDLCWLQGGPRDGEVHDVEPGAYLEFPYCDEDHKIAHTRYQPWTYTPDGILCRWVP